MDNLQPSNKPKGRGPWKGQTLKSPKLEQNYTPDSTPERPKTSYNFEEGLNTVTKQHSLDASPYKSNNTKEVPWTEKNKNSPWLVDRVLDKRICDGNLEYRVSWSGNLSLVEWVNASELKCCWEKIVLFEKERAIQEKEEKIPVIQNLHILGDCPPAPNRGINRVPNPVFREIWKAVNTLTHEQQINRVKIVSWFFCGIYWKQILSL
eukprot:TRINITY_DN9539_c0_g1_i1.p1 TRINITY_DN9539_c0_g1~~TRINITY_DN9539_c0_g1_i1.p1  ORF type:complete len:207 (+),score=44.36 TRINITY_DN9539_c0_g1_i1:1-621(+)